MSIENEWSIQLQIAELDLSFPSFGVNLMNLVAIRYDKTSRHLFD